MNFIKKFFAKMSYKKLEKFYVKTNIKPVEMDLTGKKCLCLSPHADDESIGMGATLAKFAPNFDIVLLTNGVKGIKGLKPNKVIEIREKEFNSAMDIAGVKNRAFLSAQDKNLIDEFGLFKNISIADYDYIFIPNPFDQHPDHKAVGVLLKELLKIKDYKKGLKIAFYEVWSTLGVLTDYVDVNDFIETKKEMINQYQSQIAQKDYVYYITGLNQYRGMFKDKKYVEAFCSFEVSEFVKFV